LWVEHAPHSAVSATLLAPGGPSYAQTDFRALTLLACPPLEGFPAFTRFIGAASGFALSDPPELEKPLKKPKLINVFCFPDSWLKAELFYSPFFLTGEGEGGGEGGGVLPLTF